MLKQIYSCYIVFIVLVVVTLVVVTVVLLAPRKVSFLKGVDMTLEASSNPPSSSRTPLTTLSQPIPLTSVSQPTPNYAAWPTKPLHLFAEKVVRSPDEILSSTWVAKLKKMLDRSGKLVSVVFANYDYLESILNWLIAAKVRLQPPLTDVIVFCLDREIFDFLDQRAIPSIHVDPETVLLTEKIHHRNGIIWMTRMAVYRLVNYFGHDVLAYDSDAILLRNPQKLWEDHQYSDVISSSGRMPSSLNRNWGFTLCMGVILIRSTPKTELLWQSMANSKIMDDQVLLNNAFKNCHVQWQSEGKSITKQSIDGQCANGLRVTALPHSDICRRCDHVSLEGLYVWHQGSRSKGKVKRKTAAEGNMWFLKPNWKTTYSNTTEGQTGIKWLGSLSRLV